jgi:hypothetical protein
VNVKWYEVHGFSSGSQKGLARIALRSATTMNLRLSASSWRGLSRPSSHCATRCCPEAGRCITSWPSPAWTRFWNCGGRLTLISALRLSRTQPTWSSRWRGNESALAVRRQRR